MAEQAETPAGRLVEETAPCVDASTIVLLRDAAAGADDGGDGTDDAGACGIEVLLLERHIESDFAGGALVFPGGKVDPADRDLAPERWEGADPARWREALGAATDEDALGLLVAAVRETFEEADVMLARRDGRPVTDEDLASRSFAEARARLSRRGEPFDWRDWLAEEDLVLDLGALALWSWWVTPKGQHKRFDTRFFVATLPPGQSAAHDDVEMTSLRWSTPQAALEAQAAGTTTVIYPTRKNLEALCGHATAAEAWHAADRGEVEQRRIEPEIVEVDGRIMVQHPYESGPDPI